MLQNNKSQSLAIMQPYFFPYIGYWQLINTVDKFVIYDNIQFTKKGWIHRNRILVNNKDKLFSLSLKKDSDYLNVNQRYLDDNYEKTKLKILRQIENSYKKAPYFKTSFPIIFEIFSFENHNLFEYLFNSIKKINEYLKINTEIVVSSDIKINNDLKGQKKVIQFCKRLAALDYINPIGGVGLYNKDDFLSEGINLRFIKRGDLQYKQFNNNFIEDLSIIDVMMFNSVERIKEMLYNFELI